MINKRALLAKI